MKMDLENAQTNTTAKLYILKQNSFKPTAQTTNADGSSTTLIPGPVTVDEKNQKKNDVKARSMLLTALPNEHLLTFNQYKDAKTLFAAIQTRFGGFRRFTNEVNTAYGVSTDNTQVNPASTQVSTVSTQVSTANLSDAIVYAFWPSYMADDEVPTNMALMDFSDSEFNLATYKSGLESVEEQLVFYKKNEVIFCEKLAVLKKDISYKDLEISMLK
ncbi:hypothetical protein Tco_1065136, partial [Tanacetum coccineum]